MMWMDGWIVGQIYAPPSQEIWLVPKKIIYWDFMESEKGHQNSQQQESLIAHSLLLGKGRWRQKTRNTTLSHLLWLISQRILHRFSKNMSGL